MMKTSLNLHSSVSWVLFHSQNQIFVVCRFQPNMTPEKLDVVLNLLETDESEFPDFKAEKWSESWRLNLIFDHKVRFNNKTPMIWHTFKFWSVAIEFRVFLFKHCHKNQKKNYKWQKIFLPSIFNTLGGVNMLFFPCIQKILIVVLDARNKFSAPIIQ